MMLSLSFLLAVVLKGAVVLTLAALIVLLLRRAPASARHGVWAAAFAALLLLPVLEAVGPSWPVSILPASSHHISAPAPPAAPAPPVPALAPVPPAPPAPPAPPVGVSVVTPMDAQFDAHMAGFEEDMAAFEADMAHFEAEMEAFDAEMAALDHEIEHDMEAWAARAPIAVVSQPAPEMGGPFRWTSSVLWLLGVWVVGLLVVALGWLSAFASAARLVREAEPEADPEWNVLAERARRLSGLAEPVRLLRSTRLDVPIAWGFGRPAVVLPASADEWTDDRREAVLLHEMAHLRRRDAWTQVVAQAALALHWPNPLAWIGYRRFLDAREQACDDAVLQGGARPSAYAEHLVGVARGLRRDSFTLAAVAPMARRAPLEGRIRSILDAHRQRGRLGRRAVGGTVGLAALVLVPLAAFQPIERSESAAAIAPVSSLAPTEVAVLADTLDDWEAIEAAAEEVRQAEAELDRLSETFADHPLPELAELNRWRESHFRGGAVAFGVSEADWKRAFADIQVDLDDIDPDALRALALAELSEIDLDVSAEVEAALENVNPAAFEYAYSVSQRARDSERARQEAARAMAWSQRNTEARARMARVWSAPQPTPVPTPPVPPHPSPAPRPGVAPNASSATPGFDWTAIDRARRAAISSSCPRTSC